MSYYQNSIQYNNDLDAFEARMRAEEAERELDRIERERKANKEPQCCCFEYAGDNIECLVHYPWNREEEGSDNRATSTANDSGVIFGSDKWFESIKPIEF